jgi:hypothetical protein
VDTGAATASTRPTRAARRCRRAAIARLGAAAIIGAAAPAAVAADDPGSDLGTTWRTAQGENAVTRTTPEPAADAARPIEPNTSYVIPALEVVGFAFVLNEVNRHTDGNDYDSNLATIRRNLHSGWVTDSDPFKTNQLGHPYQGSMYFGFARSAGVGYWPSLGYSFGGSALWEIAGETTPPSRNDLINTGLGGSFLGEVLFRLSSLVLEHDEWPPLWREIGAAVISPPTGFNRFVFGDRFAYVFPSHDPVYYSRLQLGYAHSTQNQPGTSTVNFQPNEALAEFAIDYGLPGKPGYAYDRPFDYFTFQATTSSANGFENLLTRGLLLGTDYAVGESYRGIWGLYGNYDYIAPQTFRVSMTGLGLGTTGQAWLSESVALQGTALGGAGYAAVGTTRSATERDYNYGVAPQALATLRLILGERASIDVTGREYFVSRVAAATRGGHDNIVRLDTALTVRLYRRHAIALKYLWNRRDAFYPDVGDSSQSRGTVGIFYTYLGHDTFGAAEWR